MSSKNASNFGNLCIVPIYGYTEVQESKERADDAYFGDDYDEDMYRGLRPNTIRAILDKVGAVGENPIMATLLFRAGVDTPLASRYALYNDDTFISQDSPPKLFGVYLDADRLRVNAEPDAVLLAQGYSRKAYRGYEMIATDFWSNPESLDITSVERIARDMAQRAMLSDYHYTNFMFANQQTVIHEIMGDEKTVAELGIEPEDYADGYAQPTPVDRMGRLQDTTDFSGRIELLGRYRDLYQTLDPDVDSRGGEGEELYELRLNEAEVAALNKLHRLNGTDQITGLSLDREDRTNHGEYWPRQKDEVHPFYTNGWGDMTVRLQLEFDDMVKCYTLRVYMDSGRREAYLDKYTSELHQTSDWLAKEAGHMLASMQDSLAEETNFNEIDEFEYQDLLRLIRNIQAVTTLQ